MHNEKKYRWNRIAHSLDEINFSDNNLAEIECDGRKICIAKTTAGLKACAALCPHAGANLSEGKLDQNQNIVCCVHHYRFNLNNGRDTLGEGYFLKIYTVKEVEDGIFVLVEEA